MDSKNTSVKKLRMAILCKSLLFESWEAQSIRSVLDLDYVEVVLIIRDDNVIPKKTFVQKILNYPYKNLFYRIYKRFYLKPQAAEITDLSELLKNLPFLDCQTELKGKHSEHFSSEDIELIKSYSPDFILRFGFNIIRGEILNLAKYGVWSFHHGDEQKYRGGPAGFWEIYNDNNVNAAILQRLTEKLDAGIILRKGYFKTIKKSYSDNIDQLYFESSHWIKQVCIDIQNDTAHFFNASPIKTSAPIYKFPQNLNMVLFFLKTIKHNVLFHFEELFMAEKWNIGMIKSNIKDLTKSRFKAEIEWFEEPKKNHYKADPFIYSNDNKCYILYEEYDYETRKATIVQKEVVSGSNQTTVISEKHHLSYPFVVNQNGSNYCIPESHEDKSINLYKLDPKSHQWKWEKKLIDNIEAVDSTFFQYGGKWWLFCTLKDKNPDLNLFAFYADKLDGEYFPHRNNPIKTDIRSARPAGTPYTYEDKVYRPSQNSSKTYGGSIVINKIVCLTPFEFKEETVDEILPFVNNKYKDGIHTISSMGEFTVMDGKAFEFNLSNFKHVLKRKAGIFFGKQAQR